MRTLVIETATAACSVALIDAGGVVDARHEIVGRGHAERLLPMIAELVDGGQADAILVDCGPGSFTGIRVGLAAARGLALGWGASVAGYSALPLVAARAFADRPEPTALAVVMEGGHGEVFVQAFDAPLAPRGPFASLTPAAALDLLDPALPIVGDGVRHLADSGRMIEARHPVAADAILLAERDRNLAPTPIYGRAPDAKLPGQP
ncbi:tRNA (adenosine(37)-N6)-threonylcarbamoyltransferase complex dimerization subunit type 1 TsaB [uncultured Sphingomonas sp.]|uniref:tRNA (adenosine(37)-N6)-threonylcarbamoyltransferase complex dimerization subunit type 1 TsaB n=1 Tax=uncultured Sphingomonas sp. TaxID=158754 RepID=UPI0025D8D1C2|nr:tRNA (adenosine(37)-N6)-threonylcarbamoyltransferase complex dimerization subunit type 1 TsaB [uncultured Sphingomonas sp.]